MNFNRCIHIFLLTLLVKEISTRRRGGNDKTRHRGRSRHKDDVTQTSLETLRETKFANQRKFHVYDVIPYACLPEKMDRLVYRFENKTHVFVAFDSLENDRITEMTWIKDTKNSELLVKRSVSTLESSQADELRTRLKVWVILAASNIRQEKQFKDDMDSCETSVTSRYCLIQAFSILAQNMKYVTFKESCFKQYS